MPGGTGKRPRSLTATFYVEWVLGTVRDQTAMYVVPSLDPETGAPAPAETGGILLVRGPQVMRGYWNDAEATARVLDADGWFDTGDLVRATRRGDLVFRGRAKDTIVLAGGENVEPEPLEQAILANSSIERDRRRHRIAS